MYLRGASRGMRKQRSSRKVTENQIESRSTKAERWRQNAIVTYKFQRRLEKINAIGKGKGKAKGKERKGIRTVRRGKQES